MYPMWALRQPASWLSLKRARLVPSTSTSPSVQLSIPASRFSKVDFPEPLGPIRARKSPLSIPRVTRSSATTSKPSRAKRLLTLRTWTIVSDILRFLFRINSLTSDLDAISIAQFVHPGDGGRLASAEAFHHVIKIARDFADPDDSLLDTTALDHKNKIAAITVHYGGLRHQDT